MSTPRKADAFFITMNNTYITIQNFMISELKLKGNELILYALIYGFSQDGHSEFYGSISYIQNFLQLSRPSVISLLKKLQLKGFIVKTKESHFVASKESLLVKKVNYTSKETLPPSSKESLLVASKETLPNNNKPINNTNNKNIDSREHIFKKNLTPYKEKYSVEMLKEFFLYWTEKNRSGKKMRFEMEKTWDLSRRLAKWHSNELKFEKRKKVAPKKEKRKLATYDREEAMKEYIENQKKLFPIDKYPNFYDENGEWLGIDFV